MLRLLTQGQTALARPDLLRARTAGVPLLSRIGLMLLRSTPASNHGTGTATLPR